MAECLKKNAETCFGATWNASAPAPVEDNADAAVRGGRMKRREFYCIDARRQQTTRPAGREFVMTWTSYPGHARRFVASGTR
jgi:hypothetical protein